MEKKVKRIAVLTSGGDAPGMNAAIRAVARSCIARDIDCLGIKRGYNGLLYTDYERLTSDRVSGIISRGGTILYTARSEEFNSEKGVERAAANCHYLGIDAVVTIGGDGTFRGARDLSKHGVKVIGIPATIDNDIASTHYSIGYDTACNTALEAIDKLRDTMQSHERCSVIEVMGRDAGHLAVYVGTACGATAVLVPEMGKIDYQRDLVSKIRAAHDAGYSHFMVVCAEGIDSTEKVTKKIRSDLGLDPRVAILGYIQRGGTPTARDRVAAANAGYHAVKILATGGKNRVVCLHGDDTFDVDIEEALLMKKGLPADAFDILEAMAIGRKG